MIYPEKDSYAIYLHPEIQAENEGLSRCLGVAATVAELLDFIEEKQGDLQHTDILIKQTEQVERPISSEYWWIILQPDGFWAIFEDIYSKRNLLAKSENLESLLAQYYQKNSIISF